MSFSTSNELGIFLRELRGNRTLREVAKYSKLSHSFVRQIELGLNAKNQPFRPATESLIALADYYQIPVEILLKKAGITDEKKPMIELSGREFELLYLFNKTDVEVQELVLQLLRKMLSIPPTQRKGGESFE